MLLKQPYKKAEHLSAMYNVGAGMDIPVGRWYDGIHGEALLNGGQPVLSGYVGGGNLFKTTVALYKNLTMMSRVSDSTGSMYETEMNTQPGRITDLANQIPEFLGEDVIETERFVLTNRIHYSGDEWYDETKEWLDLKFTSAQKDKNMRGMLPFLKKGSVSELMETIIPTLGMLDSFSDFVTKDIMKMTDDVSLGEKGAETMFMRQGISKLRMLSEYPPLLHKAAHYFSMTAQVGPIFNMDQYNPEKKKLSNIQGNVKMKGVTDKFSYIMNSILQMYNLEKLLTKDKTPEFPRDEYDVNAGDTDLNVLHAIELRGKSGPSGIPIRLVVSQKHGVQPAMTEFYNLLRHPDRFGIEGSMQNYNMVLCPDVKLSRTKVRSKINESRPLQRALNISMELMQMSQLMPELRNAGLMCTAEELFQGVKEKGFDWDQILGETRGWWTVNNDDHPIKFLSTLDLMRMRIGKYKPYWM
jgi:hypothetical protein